MVEEREMQKKLRSLCAILFMVPIKIFKTAWFQLQFADVGASNFEPLMRLFSSTLKAERRVKTSCTGDLCDDISRM